MKIKAPVDFESFSDGVCSIYSEEDDEQKVYKYVNIGFSNRTLGYKRHFAAKAVNINVNSVIRIPLIKGIDNYDKVEILGVGVFEIELIQPISDSNPDCMDLTLKQ